MNILTTSISDFATLMEIAVKDEKLTGEFSVKIRLTPQNEERVDKVIIIIIV